MGGGKAFYTTMIGSQAFSEPVPLECEFHNRFLVSHPPLPLTTYYVGQGGYSGLKLDSSLFPGELGSGLFLLRVRPC